MVNLHNRWLCLGVFVIPILLFYGCGRCDLQQTDEDPLKSGWEHYRLGEFDRAVTAFEAVLEGRGGSTNQIPDATYALAVTWDLRMPVTSQKKKLAAELYRTVFEQYPESRPAPWSMLALARMRHLVPVGKEPDYKAVREAYLKVWDTYPDAQAGQEAFVHLQSTYIGTMDREQTRRAARALRDFIAKHPDSKLRYAARVLLVQAYQILDEPDELLHGLIQVLDSQEIDKSNPFIENSWRYWTIAVTAEFEAGDFDTARRYYRKLMQEYPQDIRYYGCEEALKRMDRTEAALRAGGGKEAR